MTFTRIRECNRAFFACALLLASVAALCFADDPPDRNAVLGHLNGIISWYREASARVQPGELPSDAIFQQNIRSLAAQATQLAFQSARAQAALLGGSQGSTNATEDNGGTQDYAQVQARVQQRINDAQDALDGLNKQIASAPAAKRKQLIAQRDTLKGQTELNKAMLDAIDKMSKFVTINSASKQGLDGSINELANSVPEVLAPQGSAGAAMQKANQAVAPTTPRSAGLVGQLVTLYDQVQTMRAITRLQNENARVLQTATNLRDPLRTEVRATIAQGQAPVQPGVKPPAKPADFTQIVQRFNQQAAAIIPLNQEIVLLQQSQANLQQWRASITSESKHDLVALLFRVFGIAFALGVVWVLSEVWRRLTFRYVHDARRRRQFLVLRRFVMGFFFAMVVVLGFVSEFGSLATYAGFVTAGIAVGLQTLLLSVAAYFFVVGRYGIRIGDRISVAGVTGDVVDVGLVRIYIMELAGTGVDLYPSGRIAVFSNSVLFQPTTPLFKQVPGTEYAWHEVVIAVNAASDHRAIQQAVLGAVNSVFGEYREQLERQQGTIGDRMEIVLKAPVPEAKYQLGDDGLALAVRYPVLLTRAAEIDDRVAQGLLDILGKDGPVKAGAVGTPKIRAAVKG